jgi:hypothetical protein
VFSPCFILVGVFLASFQGGFEALDDERHFVLVGLSCLLRFNQAHMLPLL